ncbi:hypothetical protein, conserved [Trypanosoma brucei brucei TREU927]|uniref:Uncharacterized protein n=1 Tax=Trypanosoma brucei brucei (strain 927/4 GUTat10.1) TaxID=185431 RepID=Q57WF4_TRYB2|nr:hypothetical protein, conserved [Trypanosoma brucei brucei TREU927]AAX70067.1 hypothetical protein, conserved [Trypanosoma brucei]AAZ12403.1 hypothetical protein, conserved [Trypanosoma brucei brucei TREU927]
MASLGEFCVSVVDSVDSFQSIFTSSSFDHLLLCYEADVDAVTAADLIAFERVVKAAATEFGTRLGLHLWNCSDDAFGAARTQLGKEKGTPLLLIVYRGEIADMLHQPLANLVSEVALVCQRLASYQRGDSIAVVSSLPLSPQQPVQDDAVDTASVVGQRMTVDIARLIEMGKRLMTTGRAEYAEKIFGRALGTLDAMSSNCGSDTRLRGSTAMCLAWVSLAILVQGRCADDHLQRLRGDYEEFCVEFESDAARVCATQRMMHSLTIKWKGDVCSEKRLRSILADDPHKHDHRCALVVTLFLSGDLERCLTEALKLHAFGVPFGAVALSSVRDYVGPEHPLFQLTDVPS